MSSAVFERSSSHDQPYSSAAALLAARICQVSTSYSRIGCGFASNTRRYALRLSGGISWAIGEWPGDSSLDGRWRRYGPGAQAPGYLPELIAARKSALVGV